MHISIEEVLKHIFHPWTSLKHHFWPRHFYPKSGRIQPFGGSFRCYKFSVLVRLIYFISVVSNQPRLLQLKIQRKNKYPCFDFLCFFLPTFLVHHTTFGEEFFHLTFSHFPPILLIHTLPFHKVIHNIIDSMHRRHNQK